MKKNIRNSSIGWPINNDMLTPIFLMANELAFNADVKNLNFELSWKQVIKCKAHCAGLNI